VYDRGAADAPAKPLSCGTTVIEAEVPPEGAALVAINEMVSIAAVPDVLRDTSTRRIRIVFDALPGMTAITPAAAVNVAEVE
jgi:hypothetical protein